MRVRKDERGAHYELNFVAGFTELHWERAVGHNRRLVWQGRRRAREGKAERSAPPDDGAERGAYSPESDLAVASRRYRSCLCCSRDDLDAEEEGHQKYCGQRHRKRVSNRHWRALLFSAFSDQQWTPP